MDTVDPAWPSESERLDLRSLVALIKRGQCVLVLGPRVAVRQGDAQRTPLDEILADQWLQAIPADPVDSRPAPLANDPVARHPGLRQAAERRLQRREPRINLEVELQDFFRAEGQQPTELHQCLAQLPFQLCISTALDDMMSNAFAKADSAEPGKKKTPSKAWFNFTAGQGRAADLAMPTVASPLVFHLLGHPEDPQTAVLGEGDLIDFVAAIVKNDPPLPDRIRAVLADQATSFLFLGFGFHNWYLRLLLKVLNVYNHRNGGMAFEDTQFFARPDHGEAVGFFSGDRAIKFGTLRWEAFARQLLQEWRGQQPATAPATALGSVVSAAPAAVVAPPANAPLVFMSYASPDRPLVTALSEALEARGLRVWRDDQDLQSGDNWNKVLVSLISDQVDYVVVVQTPVMLSRVRGVFHEEIAVALKQQGQMGYFDSVPLRFILPVRVGDCGVLPSLKDLHVIDAGTPEGVAALVKAVLVDWDRREQVRTGGRAA